MDILVTNSLTVDRSHRLFNFVPREKILTVKLARLSTSTSAPDPCNWSRSTSDQFHILAIGAVLHQISSTSLQLEQFHRIYLHIFHEREINVGASETAMHFSQLLQISRIWISFLLLKFIIYLLFIIYCFLFIYYLLLDIIWNKSLASLHNDCNYIIVQIIDCNP